MTWLVGATMSAQNPGGNPEARKVKNPVPATADSVAAGEKLFQKYCGFCHGPGAKGDGALAPKDSHPADLTDDKWDHGSSDGEIFAVVQNGWPVPTWSARVAQDRFATTLASAL